MEETACQRDQQRATTYYTGHLHFSRDNRRFALLGSSECAKLLKGIVVWSGRQDSNLRLPAPKADSSLPAKCPVFNTFCFNELRRSC